MTGRKGRVVQTDGGIQYESRSEVDAPMETLNVIGKYYYQLYSIHFKKLWMADLCTRAWNPYIFWVT